MARFMQIKFENSKTKQSEVANQVSYSSSTFQRYRNDLYMLLPYRIQPNNTNKRTKKLSNTNFDNYPHREQDLKKTRVTSKDLAKNETITNTKWRNKNTLKAGSVHKNVEINDQNLDEILDKNDT